jgi:hypothetical protein
MQHVIGTLPQLLILVVVPFISSRSISFTPPHLLPPPLSLLFFFVFPLHHSLLSSSFSPLFSPSHFTPISPHLSSSPLYFLLFFSLSFFSTSSLSRVLHFSSPSPFSLGAWRPERCIEGPAAAGKRAEEVRVGQARRGDTSENQRSGASR